MPGVMIPSNIIERDIEPRYKVGKILRRQITAGKDQIHTRKAFSLEMIMQCRFDSI
jgi:hypothetical protein